MSKLHVLDLFSGIGGFSLGLERTCGFETVAFCEIEPFCQQQLLKHWPEVPCHHDVRKLCGTEIGSVDLICGGFPCQDLSACGTGLGLEGERSGLWYEFARLIGELRPRFVIVENSPELLDRWIGDILGTLATFGYDAEWHCIPLAATGAPHGRDRAWIIAYPIGFRQQGQGQLVKSIPSTPEAYRQADKLKRAFRQGDLPYVCGGHDGIPAYVDREAIAALGNTVGPAIPELIGNAILESMAA